MSDGLTLIVDSLEAWLYLHGDLLPPVRAEPGWILSHRGCHSFAPAGEYDRMPDELLGPGEEILLRRKSDGAVIWFHAGTVEVATVDDASIRWEEPRRARQATPRQ